MSNDLSSVVDLGGWEYNPRAIEAAVRALPEGKRVFGDAAPSLAGYGAGKTVLLYEGLRAVLGKDPVYPNQTSGTCTGRAGARAGDILQGLLAAAGLCEFEALVSSEAVFALARCEIGGYPNMSDGANVADGVQACCKIGTLLRKKYTTAGGKVYDLTGADNDDLAEQWGHSKAGVPDELEAFCAEHKFGYYLRVTNSKQAQDLVAAGNVLWLGTNKGIWPRRGVAERDKDGFCTIQSETAHSMIVTATRDDRRPGKLIDNKSWLEGGWVAGPKGEFEIPDGTAWVDDATFDRMITGWGECWAVSKYEGFKAPDEVLNLVMI